jgi:hypothetical protein
MVASSLAVVLLMLLSKDGVFAQKRLLNLGWSWLIVIGTALTFLLGLVLSPVCRGRDMPPAPLPHERDGLS